MDTICECFVANKLMFCSILLYNDTVVCLVFMNTTLDYFVSNHVRKKTKLARAIADKAYFVFLSTVYI